MNFVALFSYVVQHFICIVQKNVVPLCAKCLARMYIHVRVGDEGY